MATVLGFHDVQFPKELSWGAIGGPGYSTGIVKTVTGGESRLPIWAQARCSYQVAHTIKSQAEMDILRNFFLARKGKAYGFRFHDWMDYSVKGQYLFTGPDIQGQLVKTYIDDNGYTDTRIISRPIMDTIVLYVNSVKVATGSVYYINSNGLITLGFEILDGDIISADFEFDVPVRFNMDNMDIVVEDFDCFSWNGITLIEVREV